MDINIKMDMDNNNKKKKKNLNLNLNENNQTIKRKSLSFLFFFFFFFSPQLKLHRCFAVSLPPITKRSATNPIAKLDRKTNELGAARGQHGHGRDKLARSKRKQKQHHQQQHRNDDDNDVAMGMANWCSTKAICRRKFCNNCNKWSCSVAAPMRAMVRCEWCCC
jgi:hypothetical protein